MLQAAFGSGAANIAQPHVGHRLKREAVQLQGAVGCVPTMRSFSIESTTT